MSQSCGNLNIYVSNQNPSQPPTPLHEHPRTSSLFIGTKNDHVTQQLNRLHGVLADVLGNYGLPADSEITEEQEPNSAAVVEEMLNERDLANVSDLNWEYDSDSELQDSEQNSMLINESQPSYAKLGIAASGTFDFETPTPMGGNPILLTSQQLIEVEEMIHEMIANQWQEAEFPALKLTIKVIDSMFPTSTHSPDLSFTSPGATPIMTETNETETDSLCDYNQMISTIDKEIAQMKESYATTVQRVSNIDQTQHRQTMSTGFGTAQNIFSKRIAEAEQKQMAIRQNSLLKEISRLHRDKVAFLKQQQKHLSVLAEHTSALKDSGLIQRSLMRAMTPSHNRGKNEGQWKSIDDQITDLRTKRQNLLTNIGAGTQFFQQDLRQQLASFEPEVSHIRNQSNPKQAQLLLDGLASKLSMLRSQQSVHLSLSHSRRIHSQISTIAERKGKVEQPANPQPQSPVPQSPKLKVPILNLNKVLEANAQDEYTPKKPSHVN